MSYGSIEQEKQMERSRKSNDIDEPKQLVYKATIKSSVEMRMYVCLYNEKKEHKTWKGHINFKYPNFLTVLEIVKLLKNIRFHEWRVLVEISKGIH